MPHFDTSRKTKITLILLTLSIGSMSVRAQQTVGLFQNDPGTQDGHTLFSTMGSTTTYLIDNDGQAVHSWESAEPLATSVYLLENGNLLRAARIVSGAPGSGGRIEEIAWDGTVVWQYDYASELVLHHHDVEPLPNGNVLILAWEYLSDSVAFANGRDPALLVDTIIAPEHIVEVQPTGPTSGTIVWEWHAWDHLIQDFDNSKANFGVVADHPELINLNFGPSGSDWLHSNAMAYNAQLDQIVISINTFSEFWIIDHSTTTAEAASHTGGNCGMGGDILYRWGNPQAYDAGTETDRTLFREHNVHWIAPGFSGEGNILLFNNGQGRGYSSIDEITTTVDGGGCYPQPASGTAHGPASASWTYTDDPPENMLANFISGAQRLPNGNTLICVGPFGNFIEVTSTGDKTWKYVNPTTNGGPIVQGDPPSGNTTFRCTRYDPDYPGLLGRDLTPSGFIEIYPIAISNISHSPAIPAPIDPVILTASIVGGGTITSAEVLVDTGDGFFSVSMFDDGNHDDGSAGDGIYGASLPPLNIDGTVEYYLQAVSDSGYNVLAPPNPPSTTFDYETNSLLCCGNRGDFNHSGGAVPLDLIDITDMVAYLFLNGDGPICLIEADVDGVEGPAPVNVVDVTVLVDYLFRNGSLPPPCE